MTPALRRRLADAQAMITTWDSPRFGDELLTIAPKLRVIAHCGGEVKSRFQGSLLDTLTITTAPEPMARATAELAATLLLYCGRNMDLYRGKLRERSNRIYAEVHANGTPESLIGSQVGMVGFGRIGRTLVDLMRGFDLRWRVYDPYASRELAETYPVKFVTLQSLLKQSSLLVLTAALTDETRGMLSRTNLAQLPDGACVMNVARGGLLDLEALTREVRNGRLRCAIDVTDPIEPLRPNHPLRRMPGAIVTPHIGGGAVKARHQMADDLIDDLERFLRGAPIKHRVTTAMLARMT
ncbi:MAG TPA: NAD(P)-dependent oxidoreductase [Terriglobales bacterium]|nr:NAD(P)-dependent oxidoreductase [Terriglobales bacterium]